MASLYPLKTIFDGFSKYEIVDNQTVRFFGPFLGGPFFLERVYGGHTFALAYLGLKLLRPRVFVSKIQLNLLRPGDTEIPIVVKLDQSLSEHFHSLSIFQENVLIATSQIQTVDSESSKTLSCFKPTIQFTNPVEGLPVLEDMKLLAIQPSVGLVSEKRYNKEWMFEVRPLDPEHFFGKNTIRKPISTFCKLGKACGNDKNLDPIVVLLLLADFMIFQDFANLTKSLGNAKLMFGGTTLNFTARLHDVDGIGPFTQFYTENQLNAVSQSKTFFSGKIFTISGKCLMTYCQENFTAFSPHGNK